ncbi:hypothetical protein HDU98_001749 [Podochytrium sp. JEL0797]|nr:hypothetical protein HDU98_001749 [Podochytrium sp. JEL0797]
MDVQSQATVLQKFQGVATEIVSSNPLPMFENPSNVAAAAVVPAASKTSSAESMLTICLASLAFSFFFSLN